MPKASTVKLKYHTNAAQGSEGRHSHVNYSIQADGAVSTARSTVQGLKKLAKKDKQPKDVEIPIPDGDSLLCIEEPAFDQAYLEHIEETALDDKDKATRVRPKGVCH